VQTAAQNKTKNNIPKMEGTIYITGAVQRKKKLTNNNKKKESAQIHENELNTE
jgi:hypothetical protein